MLLLRDFGLPDNNQQPAFHRGLDYFGRLSDRCASTTKVIGLLRAVQRVSRAQTNTAEGSASGGSQMDRIATSLHPAPAFPTDVPYALTSPESGLICHGPGILGRLPAAS